MCCVIRAPELAAVQGTILVVQKHIADDVEVHFSRSADTCCGQCMLKIFYCVELVEVLQGHFNRRSLFIHVLINTHTHTHTHIDTGTHTHTHTQVHPNTHTHTHTHIWRLKKFATLSSFFI